MVNCVPKLPSEIVSRYAELTIELKALDKVIEEIELRRTELMVEHDSLAERVRSILASNSGIGVSVAVNGFATTSFPLHRTYLAKDYILTLDDEDGLIVHLLKPADLLRWPEEIAQGATEQPIEEVADHSSRVADSAEFESAVAVRKDGKIVGFMMP